MLEVTLKSDERDLWNTFNGGGELALKARDTIVDKYQYLVVKTAKNRKFNTVRFIQLDELISAGNLGLLKAIDNFDVARGLPFSSYAKIRINGEILDYLRATSKISRSLADEIGLDTIKHYSLDYKAKDGSNYKNTLIVDKDNKALNSDAYVAIEMAICKLPELDQRVFKLFWLEQYDSVAIGKKLDLQPWFVRSILENFDTIKEYSHILRNNLKAELPKITGKANSRRNLGKILVDYVEFNTVREVAAYLKCGLSSVYSSLKNGDEFQGHSIKWASIN